MDTYVFNIDVQDAASYSCYIKRYIRGHSQLYILAKNIITEHILYVIFEGVAYYEGPPAWHGVAFRVAEKGECIDVLQHIGIVNSDLEGKYPQLRDYASEKYKLFKTLTPNTYVRILALNMYLTENEPPI